MFLQQFLPQLLTKRVSTECAVFRRFCFARAELSHSAGIRRTPNASRLSLSVCLFVTNAFRKIIAKMTDFHLYYSARRTRMSSQPGALRIPRGGTPYLHLRA